MADIILYRYKNSAYSRRVEFHLLLRDIKYKQCTQPSIMPRPDVAALGLQYRRIPIMSVGNDVILDSSRHVARLQQFADGPNAVMQPTTPDQSAIQFLVSQYVCKAFFRTAALILPLDGAFLKNPAFIEDRRKLLGVDFAAAAKARAPAAKAELIALFEWLENGLLADGRTWILSTEKLTAVDVEAVWFIVWLDEIPGALAEEYFGPARFPRVRAWITRFRAALAEAKARSREPDSLTGDEAARLIKAAAPSAIKAGFRLDDPVVASLGLQLGEEVTIWTSDVPNAKEKDTGALLDLTSDEIVLDVTTETGSFRLWAPRNNFHIQKAALKEKI
ncbi:hypothetical protein NLG97_g6002 [Lecanicillium saksenae]|uniref:Uncharacterized protein n=1 Tax=Lecanicillium saksenae TaxID=468837 RepID=A0ACC1QSL2_9HYPO|nr:hypothetical protein NLG97_g6002 [Lecanicillium saksenae]